MAVELVRRFRALRELQLVPVAYGQTFHESIAAVLVVASLP